MTEIRSVNSDQQFLRRAGFEKLWIWQEANSLMLEISKICKNLPKDERFRLIDQIDRSSSSVQDNISEGYTAYYYNEKIKAMLIARKEAGETQNHILKMKGKGYISEEQTNILIDRYEKLIIGINKFNSYIQEKRNTDPKRGSRTM